MLQAILDIIYPVRCPVCGEIVIPKGDRICPPCKSKLPYIQEPRCLNCSKPIEEEEQEYCSDCRQKSFQYDRGFAVWEYNDIMKMSIADYKYHSKKEYAIFYVAEMLRLYSDIIRTLEPDVIVPVPLHRSKYRKRGFNQSDIIAKKLGKGLGIPVLSALLLRTRKTRPQKLLNDRQRSVNLSDAFCYNEKEAKRFGKPISKVLLVDDIYTTGSTMEACTRVLKDRGITKVYFITICIGKGF